MQFPFFSFSVPKIDLVFSTDGKGSSPDSIRPNITLSLGPSEYLIPTENGDYDDECGAGENSTRSECSFTDMAREAICEGSYPSIAFTPIDIPPPLGEKPPFSSSF